MRLPDTNRLPDIGSPERNGHEEYALNRALVLLHECEGRITEALGELEEELRGRMYELTYPQHRRDYARHLARHVEQCWATAILLRLNIPNIPERTGIPDTL